MPRVIQLVTFISLLDRKTPLTPTSALGERVSRRQTQPTYSLFCLCVCVCACVFGSLIGVKEQWLALVRVRVVCLPDGKESLP